MQKVKALAFDVGLMNRQGECGQMRRENRLARNTSLDVGESRRKKKRLPSAVREGRITRWAQAADLNSASLFTA